MMHGNTAANIDLRAAIRQHLASGAEITAICTDATPDYRHHRYIVDADGFARSMIFNQTAAGEGAASLEAYIISKPFNKLHNLYNIKILLKSSFYILLFNI